MPQLVLEVTDAQWQRIRAAFTTEIDGVPTPPTASDMRNWIFGLVRSRVLEYEMSLLDEEKDQAVEQVIAEIEAAKRAELQAEGWEA